MPTCVGAWRTKVPEKRTRATKASSAGYIAASDDEERRLSDIDMDVLRAVIANSIAEIRRRYG